MFSIITYKNFFFLFSAILVIASLLMVFTWGLNPGIDFLGGSLIEISFEGDVPEASLVAGIARQIGWEDVRVQNLGEKGMVVRTRFIDPGERGELIAALEDEGWKVREERFSSVGPILGNELKRKAVIAVVTATVLIVLFIAYAFREVSRPVSSWKYGVIAIVALVHDVIIATGVMSFLARFFGAETNALFVSALLAILGLSVNDTIVVFDRVRENVRLRAANTFSEIVDKSLTQTITRSINTSLTTLLVLLALLVWGPESTRIFVAILMAGLFVGTYSSLFLASPLLVWWGERSQNKK